MTATESPHNNAASNKPRKSKRDTSAVQQIAPVMTGEEYHRRVFAIAGGHFAVAKMLGVTVRTLWYRFHRETVPAEAAAALLFVEQVLLSSSVGHAYDDAGGVSIAADLLADHNDSGN